MLRRLKAGQGNRTQAGVITVEACIALPIFLSFFFLLLYLTRAACIIISLDHAASQTAKHLAAASYPLAFVNEYIDERMEDASVIKLAQTGSIKLTEVVSGKLTKDSLPSVIWGDIKDDAADTLFQVVKNQVPANYYEGLDNLIKNIFLTQYENLTNGGKQQLVAQLVANYVDEKYVNPQNLTIRLVELPKGRAEYAHSKSDPLYQEAGLLPDRDFTRDDVVIQLEYKLQIPIPFFQDRTALLRATAIERAWTNGGNGIYTKEQEGLEWLKKRQQPVYVYKARTGQKYHTQKDCDYLQKSCLTLTLEEAEEMGLTPHRNCPDRF